MLGTKSIFPLITILLTITLAACTSKEDGEPPPGSNAPAAYQLSISVNQISGANKDLEVNLTSGAAVKVLADGSNSNTSFDSLFNTDDTFELNITSGPTNKDCTFVDDSVLTITNAGKTVSGTISDSNLDISITCASLFSVGGTVSGLETGNSLQISNTATINGQSVSTESISVSNGPFTFAVFLADSTNYSVAVVPPNINQVCSVVIAGSDLISGADIGDIAINCNPSAVSTFTIGGSVTGLVSAATDLVLQINSGENLPIANDGSFSFTNAVSAGDYSVTIQDPASPAQTCSFADNTKTRSITITNTNDNSLQISCVASTFTIGGGIVGLSGQGLTITNKTNSTSVTKNAGQEPSFYTLPTQVVDGTYTLSVSSNPNTPQQTCGFGINGPASISQTVAGADVLNVTVNCVTDSFAVGVSVSGLAPVTATDSKLSVSLQNGALTEKLFINSSGQADFVATVKDMSAYTLTISSQPTGQTCTFTANSLTKNGTVAAAPAVVAISCDSNVNLTGTVTGLLDATLGVGIILNGQQGTGPGSQVNLLSTTTGNSPFSFSDLPINTDYKITIASAIPNHNCAFTGGGAISPGGLVITVPVGITDVVLADIVCTPINNRALLAGLFSTEPTLQSCIDALLLTFADEVTTLTCNTGTPAIVSLAGVENLVNLTSLILNDNAIGSITELNGLTQLSTLHLANNLLTGVLDLSSITSLSDLGISNPLPDPANQNSVSDIITEVPNTNLTKLNLNGNSVVSLLNVANMSGLVELNLGSNLLDTTDAPTPSTDLSLLSGLNQLLILDISDNTIDDVTPLSTGLSQIKSLFIKNSLATLINVNSLAVPPAFGGPSVIDLQGNPGLVCTELVTLINAYKFVVGPPVVLPGTAITGTGGNCSGPLPSFSVSGNIKGLPINPGIPLSPALILQLNGANDIIIDTGGVSTFSFPPGLLPYNTEFLFTVLQNPADNASPYKCKPSPALLTRITADVTNAAVTCTN